MTTFAQGYGGPPKSRRRRKFLEKQRWFYAGLAALALSELAAPRLFHTEPAHFWFEDLPAWGSLYGLVSCVVIIAVSKLLGKLWLARPENYYDR